MSDTPSQRYAALVTAGELEHDPAQAALAARLSRLAAELAESRLADRTSGLGRLFGRRHREVPIEGLYIWGDVGRGKTMLVDLFFEAVTLERKRRAHFNEFMADVHERIHDWRQRLKRGEVRGDDPIPPVAAALAAESRLLCLDEFHVDDIADAMILGRLFTQLFAHGLVAVATSNVMPDELYAGGLNRALFLPFVELLKERMEVVRLDAAADYRLGRLSGTAVYFSPADQAAQAAMDVVWRALTGTEHGATAEIEVKGRLIRVPQACRGVARFTFAELCEAPLGAGDYLKIARTYHTLLIDGVPVLTADQRNAARRFVLLIDTLYDHRVKLVISADAEPDALNPAGASAAEFRRTASRLHEMRSQDYLAAPHGARAPEGALQAAAATS